MLPQRIILVRHAQSEGNIDNVAYSYIPDPQIPLTAVGRDQAGAVRRRRLARPVLELALARSSADNNSELASMSVPTTT